MATWKRSDSSPLRGETRALVHDETGREGLVRVRWEGLRPQFYGPVYVHTGRWIELDGASVEEREVLDREPTFA